MGNLKYLFKKVPVDMDIEDYRRVTKMRSTASVISWVIIVGTPTLFGNPWNGPAVLTTSELFSRAALVQISLQVLYLIIGITFVRYYIKNTGKYQLQEQKIQETDERLAENDLRASKITDSIEFTLLLLAYVYFSLFGPTRYIWVIWGYLVVKIFLKSGIKSYLDKHS